MKTKAALAVLVVLIAVAAAGLGCGTLREPISYPLPINPGPTDGSKLLTIGKTITDFSVYPGVGIGSTSDFLWPLLKRKGIRSAIIDAASRRQSSVAFRVRGRIFSMKNDMLMTVMMQVSGYIDALQIEVENLDRTESRKLYEQCVAEVAKILGPGKPDTTWKDWVKSLEWQDKGRVLSLTLYDHRESKGASIWISLHAAPPAPPSPPKPS